MAGFPYHRASEMLGWQVLPPDVSAALRDFFERQVYLPLGVVAEMLRLRGDPAYSGVLATPPGTAYRLLYEVAPGDIARMTGSEPEGDSGVSVATYVDTRGGASSWTMDPSQLARISWDVTGGDSAARMGGLYALLSADTAGGGFLLNPDALSGHGYDYQREVLSVGPVAARLAWIRVEDFDPDNWHWESDEERLDWEEDGTVPPSAYHGGDVPELPEVVSELLGMLR